MNNESIGNVSVRNRADLIGPVYLGSSGNQTGQINFWNALSYSATALRAGNASAAVTYTLPTAAPGSNYDLLAGKTDGTMSWITSGLFNVKAYGAIGDGVTDDAAAVQAAATAAYDAGGGTVFFPAGTYICSPSIADNVRLLSFGGATVNGRIFIVGDYVTIEGLKIAHVANDTDKNAISCDNVAKAIKGLRIIRCDLSTSNHDANTGNCILLKGRNTYPVTNVLIEGCYLHDCDRAGIEVLDYWSDIVIVNNYFKTFTSAVFPAGISLSGALNNAYGFVVANNYFQEVDLYGVELVQVSYGVVENNTFKDIDATGWVIQASGSTNVGITIRNNQTVGVTGAVALGNMNDCLIDGNVFYLVSALTMSAGTNNTISGNVVTSPASNVIIFDNSAENHIENNYFESTSTNSASVAFVGNGGSSGNLLRNNTIVNSSGVDWAVSGTTTTSNLVHGNTRIVAGVRTPVVNPDGTGYIGETVVSSVTSFANTPATNVWGDVTSITLTPGIWDVTGLVYFTLNGATMTGGSMGIGTASGTSATGVVGPTTGVDVLPPTTGSNSSGNIPSWRKTITGSTTYYLKVLATFSAGQPQASGTIHAVRVADYQYV